MKIGYINHIILYPFVYCISSLVKIATADAHLSYTTDVAQGGFKTSLGGPSLAESFCTTDA